MYGVFYLYLHIMNHELITRVKTTLKSPKTQLRQLFELCKELCNHSININCSSCITEGVMLLSNWLKNHDTELESQTYFRKAINGEYELKPIKLFVQVYNSNDEARQKELDACLRINKERKHFYEIIEIEKRLTYAELFEMTKQHADSINVIANSDIYFDETILYSRFMDENTCYALSRWDYVGDKMAVLFDRKDSQDVWIFNGAVKPVRNGKYTLGTKGCDNAIAFELKSAGYSVLNPARTIHALHLHRTNLRTYDAKSPSVPEPYYFIKPHY